MRAKTEDAILQSVISKRYLGVNMSDALCRLGEWGYKGGGWECTLLSFLLRCFDGFTFTTGLQLVEKSFTILARASHQSRVLNESHRLLTYESTLDRLGQR